MFAIGQVVFSKQGRDKDNAFVVIASENDYAFLVDGRVRKLSKPKRKKNKHIMPTYHIDYDLAEKITKNEYLNDADFRKALQKFQQ